MGYKIEYGKDPVKKQPARFWSGKARVLTAVFFLLFILSVKLVFEEEAQELRAVLLPGTMEGAETVVGELVSSLQSGVPLKDAVTAFCRQIIAGAELG